MSGELHRQARGARPVRAAGGAHLRARGGRLAVTVGSALYTVYFSVLGPCSPCWPWAWGCCSSARDPPRTDGCAGCRACPVGRRVPGARRGTRAPRGSGPWVLVSNHVSYVDSVAILAALPVDFRAVAKQEVLSWPWVGTAVRRAGHLTVERFDTSQSSRGSRARHRCPPARYLAAHLPRGHALMRARPAPLPAGRLQGRGGHGKARGAPAPRGDAAHPPPGLAPAAPRPHHALRRRAPRPGGQRLAGDGAPARPRQGPRLTLPVRARQAAAFRSPSLSSINPCAFLPQHEIPRLFRSGRCGGLCERPWRTVK